jgi:hypothetical protein
MLPWNLILSVIFENNNIKSSEKTNQAFLTSSRVIKQNKWLEISVEMSSGNLYSQDKSPEIRKIYKLWRNRLAL